jgi:hypothetical protein
MGEEINMATIQVGGIKAVFNLNKKDFSTGSKGYHGTGKFEVAGKKFQVNIQLVEIGSKPKTK